MKTTPYSLLWDKTGSSADGYRRARSRGTEVFGHHGKGVIGAARSQLLPPPEPAPLGWPEVLGDPTGYLSATITLPGMPTDAGDGKGVCKP